MNHGADGAVRHDGGAEAMGSRVASEDASLRGA